MKYENATRCFLRPGVSGAHSIFFARIEIVRSIPLGPIAFHWHEPLLKGKRPGGWKIKTDGAQVDLKSPWNA